MPARLNAIATLAGQLLGLKRTLKDESAALPTGPRGRTTAADDNRCSPRRTCSNPLLEPRSQLPALVGDRADHNIARSTGKVDLPARRRLGAHKAQRATFGTGHGEQACRRQVPRDRTDPRLFVNHLANRAGTDFPETPIPLRAQRDRDGDAAWRVTHSGFAERPESAAAHAAGWKSVLSWLSAHHVAQPM